MDDLRKIAKAFGFGVVYCLRPEPFAYYRQRRKEEKLPFHPDLVDDPRALFPWANALLLLIMPYRPYPADSPIASNYPFNNASYHASASMIRYLNACGIRAERAYVPFRELAMRNGIGIALQNGMMALPPYGTRFVTQVIAIHMEDPVYHEADGASPACAACGACRAACPAGAIDETGLHVEKCIRAYMQPGLLPDHVMRAMTKTVGCDRCQEACPYNSGLGSDNAVPDAFSLDRLVRDDCADALRLIGSNMRSGDRLCQHALIVAANRGSSDLLPAIEKMADDPRPQIRQAAAYAISLLRKS